MPCYKNPYTQRRVENKICVKCSNPVDRDGVLCSECLEKQNTEKRADYKFYIGIGICPRCRRNRILGQERSCPECRAYEANYMSKVRSKNREEYNKKMREYRRELTVKRKAQGMCTRCGKREAETGYSTCSICRIKSTTYKRNKYGHPNRSEERLELGICYFCDNPVKPGLKVCEYHHNQNIEASKKVDREKHIWRKSLKVTK